MSRQPQMSQITTSLSVTRGVTAALDRQLAEATQLADLARRLLTRMTVDTVAQEVLTVLAEHLATRHTLLALRRVSTGDAVVHYPGMSPQPIPTDAGTDTLLGRCLAGKTRERSCDLPDSPLLPASVALPWIDAPGATFVGRDFASGRLVLGVGLGDAGQRAFDTAERMQALVRIAIPAIEGALLHEDAESRARTDALTGLGNRVGYDEAVKAALESAKRYGTPLSLVMIDLDHFKQINDQLGHEVGDMILRDLAALLRQELRAADGCFRLGGDEFVVLLPNAAPSAAQSVFERITDRVATSSLKNFGASMSYGIASYPEDGRIVRQLAAKADKRMYAHKAERRAALTLHSDI